MALLKTKLNKLFKKGFLQNVFMLMIGTAFGQAVLIFATPILTRIYTPEAFGIYGNFTAIAAIVTVIISLRYELSIVLPKSNDEARKLVSLSLLIAFVFSILFTIIVVIFGDFISANVNDLNREYMFFISFYVFLVGIFQILNYWFTRNKSFKLLAIAQSGRSLLTSGIQLFIGLFLLIESAYGLIIGQIVGQLFAVLYLMYILLSNNSHTDFLLKINDFKRLAKKYKDFPLYSTWNSFINTLSIQLPILIITYYFSASIAGLYMLGHRLVNMPLSLISRSVSQVFLQKVAVDKANSKYNNNTYYLWKVLMPISILINFIIILLAPWGFGLVLGEKWIIAGEYARWISLWTLFQFIASPLSSVSYTHNKQRLFFWLQVLLLFLRISVLLIGGIVGSAMLTVALFSMVSALFNLTTTSMYVAIESGIKKATKVSMFNLIVFGGALLLLILL